MKLDEIIKELCPIQEKYYSDNNLSEQYLSENTFKIYKKDDIKYIPSNMENSFINCCLMLNKDYKNKNHDDKLEEINKIYNNLIEELDINYIKYNYKVKSKFKKNNMYKELLARSNIDNSYILRKYVCDYFGYKIYVIKHFNNNIIVREIGKGKDVVIMYLNNNVYNYVIEGDISNVECVENLRVLKVGELRELAIKYGIDIMKQGKSKMIKKTKDDLILELDGLFF